MSPSTITDMKTAILSAALGKVNDAPTQLKIRDSVSEALTHNGHTNFYVQCDAMLNTPEIIDNHQCAVKVYSYDIEYYLLAGPGPCVTVKERQI